MSWVYKARITLFISLILLCLGRYLWVRQFGNDATNNAVLSQSVLLTDHTVLQRSSKNIF
jgi:hypothetical protein